MYASTGQVAAQKRRTARSLRFLIRLGILGAAFAAAYLAGTAAAQADEQNAAPEVVQGESEPNEPSLIDLTDLSGIGAAPAEIVADAAELVEEVPAAGVAAPVIGTVSHAVGEVVAAGDTVVGGPSENGAGTEVPAPQAPAPQAPAPQAPAHQSSAEPVVLSAVGDVERPRRHSAPTPLELPRPTAARTAGSGAADLRSESDAAAPVEAPGAVSSDLGGSIPLSELLDGDHGVVSGGGVAADRATPDSSCYGDRAGLVSDPVHTDARPQSEPVARPGFAPD